MRILAIDTALAACSAAVLDTAAGVILASETLAITRGHAEAIMPVIAKVMDEAGVDFPALDRIAVTIGPGSFTGLRVGISAARGLALAAGKPVVGLTTLSSLAAPHVAADNRAAVMAVIDARHEQVYMQMFGPGGRTLVAPRIAPVREAARAATAGGARVVGNAAELVRAAWPPSEPPPQVLDQCAAPDIAWVARLGAVAAEGQAPPKPLYLRAPDAQPQHAAQLPRR